MKKAPRGSGRRAIWLPGVAGEPLGEWVIAAAIVAHSGSLQQRSLHTAVFDLELEAIVGAVATPFAGAVAVAGAVPAAVAVALAASLAAACELATPVAAADSCCGAVAYSVAVAVAVDVASAVAIAAAGAVVCELHCALQLGRRSYHPRGSKTEFVY